MPVCLIGLGSNLGDRGQNLTAAVDRLAARPNISIMGKSAWHETSPVGGPADQAAFLNGVVTLQTSLGPQEILAMLLEVESQLGRTRTERWGPRTIDLDLLLYDELVLSTPSLVLPHPRMAWRQFVLIPAAEVAATMLHPPTGWTVARLLEHLDTAAPYVAITGSIGAGKSHLARRLAEAVSGEFLAERLDLPRLEAFYADPAGHAWETELEFLRQRAELLAADSTRWTDARPTISDFWFDQSAAFARVWLPNELHEPYESRFRTCRGDVVRPKLLVLLDVPADRLLQQVRRRGRHAERNLTEQRLAQIGQAIAALATEPDQGPVLKLTDPNTESSFEEVLAAIRAMEPEGGSGFRVQGSVS